MMTPSYDYKWVITGNSTNKGRFREEGSGSTLRPKVETRDEASLRAEIIQGIIEGYLSASEPWRRNPMYLGLTDLQVELGQIEVIDEDAVPSIRLRG